MNYFTIMPVREVRSQLAIRNLRRNIIALSIIYLFYAAGSARTKAVFL